MATLVSFWSFFGDRMADLGLIDFKLGLYIKVNVNNWQNKYEVHISKNVAKMAILWPKIGQRHFGARASHGHNLAIFHPILTNEHTKMTNSLRRIEWNKKLSSISLLFIYWFFGPIFAPRPHMGIVVRMDSKLPSSCWYMSWPSWPAHVSKLCSYKNQG